VDYYIIAMTRQVLFINIGTEFAYATFFRFGNKKPCPIQADRVPKNGIQPLINN
jgi:hypothetical protein